MAPTLWLTLNVTFSMLHLNFRLKTVKNLYLGDELKARYYHCEERKILYWTLNLEIFESKLWHSVTHFTDCVCVVPKFCLWGFPSLCKQDEGKFGDKIHWSRSLPVKQMSNCLPGDPPILPTLSKSYSVDLAISWKRWRPLSDAPYSPLDRNWSLTKPEIRWN